MSDITKLRHMIERYVKQQKRKGDAWWKRKGIKDRINDGLMEKVAELGEELDRAADELIDAAMTAFIFEAGPHLTTGDRERIAERLEELKSKASDRLLAFIYDLVDRIW